MSTDEQTRQEETTKASPVKVSIPTGLSSSSLKRATEYLFECDKIRPSRSKAPKYRRYVDLRTQAIYDSLVGLYRALFTQTWQDFRHVSAHYPPADPANGPQHLARCYISGWFHDLYYMNRKALLNLSGLAEIEYYRNEIPPNSEVYDDYLCYLSASIRPTHIVNMPEDVMYLPIISRHPDVYAVNPFQITNWNGYPELFSAIIMAMNERKRWKMSPLPTNYIGRPCWLFDWHTNRRVAAPFHCDGNFTNEDITLAYVLGEACSPNIGIRDDDEWQFFPDASIPVGFTADTYERITPRTMWGSFEVRTVTTDEDHVLPATAAASKTVIENSAPTKKGKAQQKTKAADKTKKAATAAANKAAAVKKALTIPEKNKDTSTSAQPGQNEEEETDDEAELFEKAPRFRITDWCYYFLIVHNYDDQTRFATHKILTMN